jgi:hypothetical protein
MAKDDWRSPDAYHYVTSLDPGGLAWEFLRRNSNYRAEYFAEQKPDDVGIDTRALSWGLRFPR